MTEQEVVDQANQDQDVTAKGDAPSKPACEKIEPADFYKHAALILSEYMSNSFKAFVDFVDVKQESKVYSDFQKVVEEKSYYVVELSVSGAPFLFLVDTLFLCRMGNKFLGGAGDVVSEVPEKLSFADQFIAEKLAGLVQMRFEKKGYDLSIVKSESDLKYFKLFFPEDKISYISSQIKYAEEDAGMLFVCQSETFFEDIYKKASTVSDSASEAEDVS